MTQLPPAQVSPDIQIVQQLLERYFQRIGQTVPPDLYQDLQSLLPASVATLPPSPAVSPASSELTAVERKRAMVRARQAAAQAVMPVLSPGVVAKRSRLAALKAVPAVQNPFAVVLKVPTPHTPKGH